MTQREDIADWLENHAFGRAEWEKERLREAAAVIRVLRGFSKDTPAAEVERMTMFRRDGTPVRKP